MTKLLLALFGLCALTLAQSQNNTSPSNETLSCEAVFGSIPSQFNGFFFGNFIGSNSEVLGRLAVGGNCTLNGGYGVGTQIHLPNGKCSTNGTEEEDVLVVGENLNWQTGSASGNIVYGNLLNLGSAVSNGVHNIGCAITQDMRIDFSLWQKYLFDLSFFLSTLKQTATNAQLKFGTNLEFSLGGAIDFEVVELDALQLLNATVINVDNISDLSANVSIIINVRGSTCGLKNIGLQVFQSISSRIVWNFIGCTSCVFTAVNIPGSVLAINASIDASNGNIDGQMFGWNCTGNLEFHNVPFNSCLPIPSNTTTTPNHTQPCCHVVCEQSFGDIPSLYNAFIFTSFSGQNSEILGRLAAGGDVTLTGGYAVASQLFSTQFGCNNAPAGTWLFNLVCGGSINWQNGRLTSGFLVYGNNLNLGSAVSNGLTEQGCSAIKNASFIDFQSWQFFFSSLSQSLTLLNNTVTDVSLQFGSNLVFSFSGNSSKQFEVISLNASLLSSARTININNFNTLGSLTTIIFNVHGSTCSFSNMGFGPLTTQIANRIIWNFIDCQQLSISGVSVPGSILAVNAACNGNSGNLEGQLIAKSFTGSLEFHNVLFTGCVYECQQQSDNSECTL